jgi:hypothetical protein
MSDEMLNLPQKLQEKCFIYAFDVSEVIIREIFERCGEMTTIRLSKKNFCHIRFVFENSVDAAIYLSGK